jgi:uncharacterized tellurite resistance protein B-like protein
VSACLDSWLLARRSPSGDDGGMVLMFVVMLAAPLGLLAGLSLFGGHYWRSIRSSLAALVSGGGARGMAAMDRGLAIAEIGALALLADGEVNEDERAALAKALAADHGSVSVDEALARARRAAPDATDGTVLREAIARAGRRLDAPHREQAYRLVVKLACAGAEMTGDAGGYRGPRRADPGTLVALAADALDIPREVVTTVLKL